MALALRNLAPWRSWPARMTLSHVSHSFRRTSEARLVGEGVSVFGAAGCLHERFEERARLGSDRVAVVCDGESLTFAELDRRANGLAWRLQSLGVGPDVLVGLRMERSLDRRCRGSGDPEGGRGVRAARSGVSAGAGGVHVGRLGCAGGGDGDGIRVGSGGDGRDARLGRIASGTRLRKGRSPG